ncbi:hypothetical protein JVT61DRAFT_13792 [Boletus reticuloceps]|uniref:Uncharacterized protein n=1 Tax=Boletus reticuloceps TaxID=495285 RepID=A0A8I2YVH5_9AGAM|nr:hypothetical protein JVT61DRAFT_13792 [Boletus reticuloceps]
MQSTRYDISFDDMNFTIFDTIGLEEPQMGVNGYLKAIEKAYELVARLRCCWRHPPLAVLHARGENNGNNAEQLSIILRVSLQHKRYP